MTTSDPTLAAILTQADAGTPVDVIARQHNLSPVRVYSLLRTHRPDRTRSPRRRSSPKRAMVLGLLERGHEPARVAFLCQCSRAWVYRIRAGL